MKILVTGAKGQLGRSIQACFPSEWNLFCTTSMELDISDRQSVIDAVSIFRPDCIINAAAYTAVDKAEAEPDIAKKVNTDGIKYLAEAAAIYNARLFHISTDYVFDGTSQIPYKEEDTPNPLSVYGTTKLAGEVAATQANPNTVIIRTSWVFSEYGNNFVKTMLKLGNQKKELNIVDDQYGCPTYAGDLALAILALIKNTSRDISGIYHYCGNEITTWHEFALKIFKYAYQIDALKAMPIVNPIPSVQYPVPAKRPHYSVMNCKKINAYGIDSSNWDSRLIQVITQLSKNGDL